MSRRPISDLQVEQRPARQLLVGGRGQRLREPCVVVEGLADCARTRCTALAAPVRAAFCTPAADAVAPPAEKAEREPSEIMHGPCPASG